MSRRLYLRLNEALRQAVLSVWVKLDNLAERVAHPTHIAEIASHLSDDEASEYWANFPYRQHHWRDRLSWWLRANITDPMFNWAYYGSQEELFDAWDVPDEYRTSRQKAYLFVQEFLAIAEVDSGFLLEWSPS